jgi:glutamine amidotransferase
MITIVNYGLGNIGAFVNMYKRLNIPTKVAVRASDLDDASHVILPGVGAFDHAMNLLNQSGMRAPLEHIVERGETHVLGICVGMQILADSSEEGVGSGLGWIGGTVRAFAGNPSTAGLPLPHMGWNNVSPVLDIPIFKGLSESARFYFLHSYYFECNDANNVSASAEYGFKFACAVRKNHVYGVQFHPEKSHQWGTALLKNFAELQEASQ